MENKYYNQLKAQVQKKDTVFIAPGAHVLGNIELGEQVSIWYNAVLRADFDQIKIGARSNVQENVIMHVDPGYPISIGTDNIIGHGAVLHGCSIGNNNLIGIRATVLNGAKIGNNCIIGAHALVTEGMEVPDYSMVLGVPGKIVKTLPEGVKDMIQLGVHEYLEESKKYLQ
ncbi:MAG: gamma carbonic anhydrase family protein [Chitinophagales bacterium]